MLYYIVWTMLKIKPHGVLEGFWPDQRGVHLRAPCQRSTQTLFPWVDVTQLRRDYYHFDKIWLGDPISQKAVFICTILKPVALIFEPYFRQESA